MKKGVLVGCFCCLVLMGSVPAEAANFNVCEWLVEDAIFEETFYESVVQCSLPKKWWKKLAVCLPRPNCCIPAACKVDPMCVDLRVAKRVKKVREIVKNAGELTCDFREISAREFLDKARKYLIENAVDLLTGGFADEVYKLIEIDLQLMEGRAVKLPSGIRRMLKAYLLPKYNEGDWGWAWRDLDNIKILSNKDSLGGMWLPEDKGAITLGPVVVVDDEHFKRLSVNPDAELEWYDLLSEAHEGLSNSLDTMAHELVHVKQQRRDGLKSFLKNYVVGTAYSGGYGNDSYEQEAYRFAARMAEFWGGNFCLANQGEHNSFIKKYDLGLPALTCQRSYGKGYEFLVDFVQKDVAPYASFEKAKDECLSAVAAEDSGRLDCRYDGKLIGYSLYWDGQRVGYDPSRDRSRAAQNCQWNIDTYPDKKVNCTLDGEGIGYELFFDGRRVGFVPSWSRAQGVSNCTWNRENHQDTDVFCSYDGKGLGYEFFSDGDRLHFSPQFSQEEARAWCKAVGDAFGTANINCTFDGQELGYSAWLDGNRIDLQPAFDFSTAVTACQNTKSANAGKAVYCQYDGKAIGYELFWNRKRVGYEPSWTEAQARSNCLWNLQKYAGTKEVDCRYQGEKVPVIFDFFMIVPTIMVPANF